MSHDLRMAELEKENEMLRKWVCAYRDELRGCVEISTTATPEIRRSMLDSIDELKRAAAPTEFQFQMNDDAWKVLVRRYARGLTVCNCGHAYLTNCGHAHVIDITGREREVFDHPVCESGCAAAKIAARDHVALCVLTEITS